MAVDALKIFAGIYTVTLNSVAIGSTTEEGFTLSPDQSIYKVKSGQSLASPKKFRTDVAQMIKFTVNQLTLEALQVLLDIQSAIAGSGTRTMAMSYTSALTEMPLSLTGPGPDGNTWTYDTTVTLSKSGDINFSRVKETMVGVELEESPSANGATTTFGTWTETPADSTAPTISSVSPADGATSVVGTANIVITFSDALDLSTVNKSNFMLIKRSDESVVAIGTPAWNSGAKTVTLDPTSTLTASADYIVVVTTGVRNVSGLNLAATSSTSFTVAA